jgi:putative FmdB family regulatory protein
MPLYAYACPVCGTKFELLRPAARRDEPVPCEACGHQEVGRSMASYACAAQGASSRASSAAPPCGGRGGFT